MKMRVITEMFDCKTHSGFICYTTKITWWS